MVSDKKLVKPLVALIKEAQTSLPKDVESALRKAYGAETSDVARVQLKEVLENIKAARRRKAPVCQDTGILSFYVKLGERAPVHEKAVKEAVVEAAKTATKTVPLRPNVVSPLTRENTKDNTGYCVPSIEFEHVPGKGVEVTVFAKGAGSENMSRLSMLNPSEGIEGIKKFVLESVAAAGGCPCPPGVVGVGIGGGSDIAARLAKKALLRRVGSRNKRTEFAKLEDDLLKGINCLGVGAMGLGGKVSCLGVCVEAADCHTGSLPVAVNINCWALRRASAKVL
jgi:fumarate hydratase subunit alpha